MKNECAGFFGWSAKFCDRVVGRFHLLSPKNGTALLLGLAVGIGLLMLRLEIEHPLALTQPATYHNFADQRSVLGLPNFWNVASNLPFAVIGIWGMVFLFPGTGERHQAFIDPRERWPYLVLFLGLFLTAFGSAWYHLAPSNATLVWDRLPMAITFAAFIAAVIAERISVSAGVKLVPFLVLFSLGTVVQWYYSELQRRGDLGWYAALQIYAVLVLLIAPLLKPRYSWNSDFLMVFALYALAKICETFDQRIYWLGHVISGHSLKHLAAAAAGYRILRMLQQRVPLNLELTGH